MRWQCQGIDMNKREQAFLERIIEICKIHGMVISHEDIGGNFLIKDINRKDLDWLRGALSCREDKDDL